MCPFYIARAPRGYSHRNHVHRRVEHAEPHSRPRGIAQRLDARAKRLQNRVEHAALVRSARRIDHERKKRPLRSARTELLSHFVLHGPAGQLGAVLAVEAHAGAVGGAVVPGGRGVLRAAEVAEEVVAAVGELHERIHVRRALRAADQSRGSVEERDGVFLRVLEVRRRNGRNGLGEGSDEDGARDLGFVQHVVGLREHAHGGPHVARTADPRVLERVLVRGERQGLGLRGNAEAHADPIVVVLPAVGSKRRVFFGVRNSVQVDQVVRIARFLRLTVRVGMKESTFASFAASGCCCCCCCCCCCAFSAEDWLAGRETGISWTSTTCV